MKSQVLINAEKDTNYCPYCMRCSGLVRMKKVETFLWKCKCGAVHDERIQTNVLKSKGEEHNDDD